MLLEERDRDRDIKYIDAPDLNLWQKQILLRELSYWMMENDLTAAAPIREAEIMLENALGMISQRPKDLTGKGALKFLIERSGLVRQPNVDYIDFYHRTFLEYLTATKIEKTGLVRALLKNHLGDDRWDQVFIMVAGIISLPQQMLLLEGMLDNQTVEDKRKLHLLALSCYDAMQMHVAELDEIIIKHLAPLQRPHSPKEATAFAKLGDLAVPFLQYANAISSFTLGYSINTLQQIASEQAFKQLQGFVGENGWSIQNNLAEAWNYFDPALYATKILQKQIELTEAIVIYTNKAEDEIKTYLELSKVQKLDIRQLSFTHLNFLASLPQLTSLSLVGLQQVSDLSFLASLPQLTSLSLFDLPQVSDLSFLASLPQLTSLSLNYLPQVSDLQKIKQYIPNLKELAICDLPNYPNLPDLGEGIIVRRAE